MATFRAEGISSMGISSTRSDLILELFEAYYERVFCFVRRSVSPSEAEDVTQEVFFRLIKHPDLERKLISASYLIKIADNLLKRRYHKNQRFRATIDQLSRKRDQELDSDNSQETWFDDEVLRGALNRLKPVELEAVRLIICEGKSYQEAAEALGVNVSTINNWKHRGITSLKQYVYERSSDDRLLSSRSRGD